MRLSDSKRVPLASHAFFGRGARRAHCAPWWLLAVVALGCGSSGEPRAEGQGGPDAGNGSGGSGGNEETAAGGARSPDAGRGGQSGNDDSTAGASGGGSVTDCSFPPPSGGGVLSVTDVPGNVFAGSIDAACDGSFAAAGSAAHAISFRRADGSTLTLSEAPLWVARFDRDANVLWAKSIATGDIETAQLAYVVAFPDGSVGLAGTFGTNATFARGEPNETVLTAVSYHAEGYVARYRADGEFAWVKQVGDTDDSSVLALAKGNAGVTYLAAATSYVHGTTIAPGELDLSLAQNEGAVLAVDAAGHFTGATKYETATPQPERLTALADGGVLFYGPADSGFVLAPGTPDETPVEDFAFSARLASDLTVKSVHTAHLSAAAAGSAATSDGSTIFTAPLKGTLTLGTGEARETTLVGSSTHTDTVVAEFAADGHLAWAAKIEGTDGDVEPEATAASTDGSVWVSGSYGVKLAAGTKSALSVAAGTPSALTVNAGGPSSSFVVRFDATGTPAWGVPFVGSSVVTRSMAASGASLVAFGEFSGTVAFGAVSVTATGHDVAFARLGP